MNLNQVKSQIEETATLKIVAEAFVDIASVKLARIRGRIERNRQFAAEIAEVLHVVHVAATEQNMVATRQKKAAANLLLTSNKRLYYGVLDVKVVDFFMTQPAATGPVDNFVVGSVGRDCLGERGFRSSFIPVEFVAEMPTMTELRDLAVTLSGYEKVMVYYPRFTSILSQQPTLIDMTGFASFDVASKDSRYYIFEPEIDKILTFFEENIMAILLEQAFLESELARTGTELSSMDAAADNAAKTLKEENRLLKSAKRQFLTMQVLETFAGLRHRTYD